MTGRRAGHQEIANLNWTILRVNLNFHPPTMGDLRLLLTSLAQDHTWPIGDNPSHSRIVRPVDRNHSVRRARVDGDESPRYERAARRHPFGHVLILRRNVAVDHGVAIDMKFRGRRNADTQVAIHVENDPRPTAVRVERYRHV